MKMSEYENYLSEFKEKIIDGYERNRMDTILSDRVNISDKPSNKILMFDEPLRAYSVGPEGELPPPQIAKLRDVEPSNVGFSFDMSDWARDPSRWGGMDSFMFDIGKNVAEREYYVIMKNLIKYSGSNIKVEKEGSLTANDINNATQKFLPKLLHPDTLILNVKNELEFRRRNEILDASLLPIGYFPEKLRGNYYIGLIEGLNSYWAPFLEDSAVIFSKMHNLIYNTPLVITFDDLNNPKKMILEKWCSSAPLYSDSVIAIIIKNSK